MCWTSYCWNWLSAQRCTLGAARSHRHPLATRHLNAHPRPRPHPVAFIVTLVPSRNHPQPLAELSAQWCALGTIAIYVYIYNVVVWRCGVCSFEDRLRQSSLRSDCASGVKITSYRIVSSNERKIVSYRIVWSLWSI